MGPLFGGDREALVGEFSIRGGAQFGEGIILTGSAGGRGRLEGSAARDAQVTGHLTLYATGLRTRRSPSTSTAPSAAISTRRVSSIRRRRGLRGYPNHYRAGESRWLLAVEDRVITPWRLWGIAQVGFVVYADAGAAAPADGWTRTYADLGAGCASGISRGRPRGSFRSASRAARARGDLAWFQVVAGTTQRF